MALVISNELERMRMLEISDHVSSFSDLATNRMSIIYKVNFTCTVMFILTSPNET